MNTVNVTELRVGQKVAPLLAVNEILAVEEQNGIYKVTVRTESNGKTKAIYYHRDDNFCVFPAEENEGNPGCSCGEADLGAPGHDDHSS